MSGANWASISCYTNWYSFKIMTTYFPFTCRIYLNIYICDMKVEMGLGVGRKGLRNKEDKEKREQK